MLHCHRCTIVPKCDGVCISFRWEMGFSKSDPLQVTYALPWLIRSTVCTNYSTLIKEHSTVASFALICCVVDAWNAAGFWRGGRMFTSIL
jgi:hypothetical protein